MKSVFSFSSFLACFACLAGPILCSPSGRAQDLVIHKEAESLIPVSISGFSGETESVLAFDLSVLGLKPNAETPEYLVNGSANGQLSGSLSMAGGHQIFSRTYSGGNPRSQAHSFADDIVSELRQTVPIFHSRIAFRCQTGGANEIYVSDFDGHNAVQLTRDHTLVEGPAWAPGDRALFYTSWKNGPPEIFEHDLSTGMRHVFAPGAGDSYSAAVSKDGRRVAFISNRNGSPNLWVCDSDGSGLRQLTLSREDDSSPTWSPDNTEICFVHRSGRAGLRRINADGGPSVPIRAIGPGVYGNLTSPNWSPDGKWIAFTCGSGSFSICVVPASGGEAKQLVAGEDPCWAPNSRTLVFTRRSNDKRILCLLDVPTKSVKDVRQIPGSCSEPSWAR